MASLWQGLPVVVSVDPHFVCLPMLSPPPVDPSRAAGPLIQRCWPTGCGVASVRGCDWFRAVDGWFHSRAGGTQQLRARVIHARRGFVGQGEDAA